MLAASSGRYQDGWIVDRDTREVSVLVRGATAFEPVSPDADRSDDVARTHRI